MNGIGPNIYTPQKASLKIKAQGTEKDDAKTAAKQVETVFLNELLRIMMEHTSFGQDRTVSTFLPVITSEMSKSLAVRGIGIEDFLMKNAATMGRGEMSDTRHEEQGHLVDARSYTLDSRRE
jgi:Rod binding domain-containing protein